MIIEDGKGSGRRAAVGMGNMLRVHAVTQTMERHTNDEHGDAYHCVFSQSPTAADDCFFYMVNSSDDSEIIVEGIWLGFINATAVDAEVYVKLGDKGTRNSATALTPANCNAGSGRAADGTFEKGADLDGGAASLTGGTEIERFVFADVQNLVTKHFNFEQDLIIPKNETMTLWATDAGATYYVTVVFNFHAPAS